MNDTPTPNEETQPPISSPEPVKPQLRRVDEDGFDDPQGSFYYTSEADALIAQLRAEVEEKDAQISAAREAFVRIREMVGATDRDPMPCEHYVSILLQQLRSTITAESEEIGALKERLRQIYNECIELKQGPHTADILEWINNAADVTKPLTTQPNVK